MRLIPRIRHVIFDWSGTLCDDHRLSFYATRDTLRHFADYELSWKEYLAQFTLPISRFYRRYTRGVSWRDIDRYYFTQFEKYCFRAQLFPGILDTLRKLRRHGIRASILSTIQQDLLEALCRHFKIRSYVDLIHGSAFDKRLAIKHHLKASRAKPSETLFIGDTAHDIDAANRDKVISGCVLSGYSNAEQLLQSQPRFVWNHPSEWPLFFKKLTAPPSSKQAPNRPIVTVGALIFNHRKKVFLVLTHKWNFTYGIPGGKIDKGEIAKDALAREIREETGMKITASRLLMVQDCIDPKEFYIPKSHFMLLNYTAKSRSKTFRLNDEAILGLWVPPKLALALSLNQPTRILLETFLKS